MELFSIISTVFDSLSYTFLLFAFLLFYALALLHVPISGAFIGSLEIFRISLVSALLLKAQGFNAEYVTVLICALAFPIGVLSALKIFGSQATLIRNAEVRFHNPKWANYYLAIFFVTLMISLHYLLVGLPDMHSSNTEFRFSSASSGLLGIPSRFATYGPTSLVVIALIQSLKVVRREKIHRLLMAVTWVLIILFFVLKGHKSSLLAFFLSLFIMFRLLPEVHRKIRGKYIILVIVSVLIAIILGTSSDGNFADYFITRIIFSGPDALTAAVTSFKGSYTSSYALINDFIYVSLAVAGEKADLFSIELARHLYGLPAGEFTVPVTPSIIGLVIYDFGLYFSPFIILFLGAFLGSVMIKTNKCASMSGLFLFFSLEIAIYQGLARGQLFYIIQNSIVVILPIYLLLRLKIRSPKQFVI